MEEITPLRTERYLKVRNTIIKYFWESQQEYQEYSDFFDYVLSPSKEFTSVLYRRVINVILFGHFPAISYEEISILISRDRTMVNEIFERHKEMLHMRALEARGSSFGRALPSLRGSKIGEYLCLLIPCIEKYPPMSIPNSPTEGERDKEVFASLEKIYAEIKTGDLLRIWNEEMEAKSKEVPDAPDPEEEQDTRTSVLLPYTKKRKFAYHHTPKFSGTAEKLAVIKTVGAKLLEIISLKMDVTPGGITGPLGNEDTQLADARQYYIGVMLRIFGQEFDKKILAELLDRNVAKINILQSNRLPKIASTKLYPEYCATEQAIYDEISPVAKALGAV